MTWGEARAGVRIDMSHVDELAEIIGRSPDEVADAAYRAGMKVAGKMKKAAQAAAPKDRPWLSRHGIQIRSWREKRGSHHDLFTTIDEDGRPVGFMVEYGTARMPPQPFLRPQMQWGPDEYVDEIMRRLDPLETEGGSDVG